jgi:hypothetical protein
MPVETPENFGEPAADPSQEVIRAYQRRLRRTRNILLAETLILVPLVVLLAALLIVGRVKRGQAVMIRFGTALEVAVRDEDTAQRILAELRTAAAGGKVPESSIKIAPTPVTAVVPASDAKKVMTEAEALAAIRACPSIQVNLEACILKVDNAAVAAALSEDDVRFALDELVSRYGKVDGLVGTPKIVTQYTLDTEARPPDRVKTSRDALIATFLERKVDDVYEFLGPKLTLDALLKKYSLTKEQLQLRNRKVDFSKLGDGSKLLVKPGKDNIEVEYQVTQEETRDVPPPVKEQPDPNLEKDKREVVTEGKAGQEAVVYRITYHNDREIRCEVSATREILAPEEKVVRVGTKGATTESEPKPAKPAPARRR